MGVQLIGSLDAQERFYAGDDGYDDARLPHLWLHKALEKRQPELGQEAVRILGHGQAHEVRGVQVKRGARYLKNLVEHRAQRHHQQAGWDELQLFERFRDPDGQYDKADSGNDDRPGGYMVQRIRNIRPLEAIVGIFHAGHIAYWLYVPHRLRYFFQDDGNADTRQHPFDHITGESN